MTTTIQSQFVEVRALLDQVHSLIDNGSQSDVAKASSILKSILPVYKEIMANDESKAPGNYELVKEIKVRLSEETNRVISKRDEVKRNQENVTLVKQVKPIELPRPPPLQGYLKKLGEKGIVKSYKKRWFLQSDTKLYYYEKEGDTNSYGYINLPDMLSVKTIDSGFELSTPGRTYNFQVLKASDLNYWTEGLKEFKKYYVSLQNTLRFASDSGMSPSSQHQQQQPANHGSLGDLRRATAAADMMQPMHSSQVYRKSTMMEGVGSGLGSSTTAAASNANQDGAHNSEIERKHIEDSVRKEMLAQQDQMLDIEIQRRVDLEKEVARLKQVVAKQQEAERAVSNIKFDLQIRDEEIDRLKKELAITEANVLSMERDKQQNNKPAESFPSEYAWSQEIATRDKTIFTLRSRIGELDESLKLKENAVTVIKRENELLREETEKKDKYISDLIDRSRDPKSPQRKSLDVNKLRESLHAHQSQNGFLMAEIHRLETQNQVQAEIKNEQIDEMKKSLDESIYQYQHLRELLIGASLNEYCKKVEKENIDVKKEYFLSLAVSVKLHRSLAGEMANVDTVSLYDEVMAYMDIGKL
eukprot:gene4248-4956_t